MRDHGAWPAGWLFSRPVGHTGSKGTLQMTASCVGFLFSEHCSSVFPSCMGPEPGSDCELLSSLPGT